MLLNSRLILIMLLCASFSNKAIAGENDDWNFTLLFPMVWVTDINGKIDVGDNSIDINTSFQDTLDSLSFGYMVEFYAKKGPWRYALKLNYAESEDEYVTKDYLVPPGIPLAPSHKIETEAVQGTTDVTLGYQLDNGLLLFTGVRYIYSKIDLEITPQGSGIIEIEEKVNIADEDLYDWLVGAEYQYQLDAKWNVIVSGDIAIAGDNDTDYSANAIVTYRISRLNTLWAGYRYLRIADKFVEDGISIKSDFITQGPTVGWAFTF